jgi:hypothetical protein
MAVVVEAGSTVAAVEVASTVVAAEASMVVAVIDKFC